MKIILKGIHFIGIVLRYLLGHILLLFGRYKKQYCNSSHFKGKYFGLYAEGWHWLVHDWLGCLVTGSNDTVPWPVSSQIRVAGWKNISFDPEDLGNFQGKGIYYQGAGKIEIGKGTYIANNVGIITANHDVADLSKHVEPQAVIIQESCWIGMNAVILPGVTLGPNTIVGAGSVVTHSFKEGHCIVAGNPARVIRLLSDSDQRQGG